VDLAVAVGSGVPANLEAFSISLTAFFSRVTAPAGVYRLAFRSLVSFCVARGTRSMIFNASGCSDVPTKPNPKHAVNKTNAAPRTLGSFAFRCSHATTGVKA